MLKKTALFALVKLILLLFIAAVAKHTIPYLGHFSFPADLNLYHLPDYLKSFANFDGLHYIKISREGYYASGMAFFPLYPLLIHIMAPLFGGNHILAALFISNTAFIVGCFYIYKLLKLLKISRLWFFIFFLVFPTSFFFHTAYTESLFFMFVVLTFYNLKKKDIGLASLVAVLASATRVVGVFLFIPFIGYFFPKYKKIQILSVLAPLIGIGAYMVYQWIAAGDPLAFVHAQPGFGSGRSTHIVLLPQVYFRYLKIFLTAGHDLAYYVAILESTVFTFALATAFLDTIKRYKTKDTFLLSIGIFSLATLIFPTLSGTFLSVPRFALLSLSSFFYLAELKNTPLKIFLAGLFGLLQIVLFALFIQGYFVA